MYKWVPDGTYDSISLSTRYVIANGRPRTVISKQWVEMGGPEDVPATLRMPWGTYPDMPAKPGSK